MTRAVQNPKSGSSNKLVLSSCSLSIGSSQSRQRSEVVSLLKVQQEIQTQECPQGAHGFPLGEARLQVRRVQQIVHAEGVDEAPHTQGSREASQVFEVPRSFRIGGGTHDTFRGGTCCPEASEVQITSRQTSSVGSLAL